MLDELNEDHPRTPEEMRIGYEDWTERAARYLREHELVSFPDGEECAVVPSPPFQRPVLAVASYMQPPPFSDQMLGHFFVPFPPDGAPRTRSRSGWRRTPIRASRPRRSTRPIPATTGTWSCRRPTRAALRQVFRTPYFSEGWALYAERMMREQGFFTDLRHEMYQYEATIFRAARIVVDTVAPHGRDDLGRGGQVHDDADRR